MSSTESASPTEFPGPTVFDTDVDRQADSTVKQEEADLQEDLALADSLNTALPGRHEDDEEVAATQQDGEEDAVDEGEEEEEMEEEGGGGGGGGGGHAPGAGGPSSSGRSGGPE